MNIEKSHISNETWIACSASASHETGRRISVFAFSVFRLVRHCLGLFFFQNAHQFESLSCFVRAWHAFWWYTIGNFVDEWRNLLPSSTPQMTNTRRKHDSYTTGTECCPYIKISSSIWVGVVVYRTFRVGVSCTSVMPQLGTIVFFCRNHRRTVL